MAANPAEIREATEHLTIDCILHNGGDLEATHYSSLDIYNMDLLSYVSVKRFQTTESDRNLFRRLYGDEEESDTYVALIDSSSNTVLIHPEVYRRIEKRYDPPKEDARSGIFLITNSRQLANSNLF